MADDEDDDTKLTSLQERAERLDEQAAARIVKIADDASLELFQHRLGLVLDDLHRPGITFVGLPAIAAGALHVAARDLARIELPARYRAAVAALRECVHVDEAAEVADKAAALATYARQARDTELLRLAMRVRARAIRRCGELISEVEAARGRRTDLELREGTLPKLTRNQAAADAGLSEHQRKTALRIAAVPVKVFEGAVERYRPPSLIELAGLGTSCGRPRRRWRPPTHETVSVQVELPYRPSGTLEEIAVQRELAVLIACWRDAGPEARKRFLALINARATD